MLIILQIVLALFAFGFTANLFQVGLKILRQGEYQATFHTSLNDTQDIRLVGKIARQYGFLQIVISAFIVAAVASFIWLGFDGAGFFFLFCLSGFGVLIFSQCLVYNNRN